MLSLETNFCQQGLYENHWTWQAMEIFIDHIRMPQNIAWYMDYFFFKMAIICSISLVASKFDKVILWFSPTPAVLHDDTPLAKNPGCLGEWEIYLLNQY